MSNIVEVNHRSKAIANLTEGANWSLTDNILMWGVDNTQTQPTDTEIDAEVTRLQAEYDANQYQRDRATAYPSLQDQADMQFHDLANSTTTWLDAIQAVKDAYPKPV